MERKAQCGSMRVFSPCVLFGKLVASGQGQGVVNAVPDASHRNPPPMAAAIENQLEMDHRHHWGQPAWSLTKKATSGVIYNSHRSLFQFRIRRFLDSLSSLAICRGPLSALFIGPASGLNNLHTCHPILCTSGKKHLW